MLITFSDEQFTQLCARVQETAAALEPAPVPDPDRPISAPDKDWHELSAEEWKAESRGRLLSVFGELRAGRGRTGPFLAGLTDADVRRLQRTAP